VNDEETDLLAADYVLGTLDAEQRRRVARALGEDERLRLAVEAWERRLSDLETGVLPITPPSGLRARVLAAIDQRAETPANGLTVRDGETPWVTIAPGVERRLLYRNDAEDWEASLFRFAPGGRLPPHPHRATEECYLIAGDLSIGSLRVGAGDFHVIGPNRRHPKIVSAGGALAYIRGEARELAG
jgi:anti-sigma factor ChrR (cupin superfamily)